MSLILDGTNGLSDVDGSASTPAIRGTDTNTGIFFPAADTIAFAEGGAEVARFDSSGNLGIGTASPSTKLDVVVGNNGGMSLVQNGTNQEGFFNFTNNTSNANGGLSYDHGTNSLRFKVNATERMRIDSSGNLLVKRTSNVSAVANIATTYNANAGNWGLGIQASVQENGTAIGFANTSGTTVGTITQGLSGTAYNTSSDYRLKENIAPMTGALAKVQALKPVTYTWKADGSDGQGFIAHELAEVVPDAVTGEKDAVNEDGTIKAQGIDTSFLVATLTAAIQEQTAIITDLKSRIEALEAK